MEDFAATIGNAELRAQLERALQGRGAFRRFRDAIHSHFREKNEWFKFKRERLQQRMADWLAAQDIEVEWTLREPVVALPPQPPMREHLLAGVLKFVRAASQLSGVRRIALVGLLA